jgi:nucleoside-diphosphate-sugar epimerase
LPDVAETIAQLLDHRCSHSAFETYHMRGHYLRNQDLLESVCRVAGLAASRIQRFPWWAVRAAAPMSERFAEMLEMRYLWEEPLEMDNARLLGRLGHEPHTPLDDALRATLATMGIISSPKSAWPNTPLQTG